MSLAVLIQNADIAAETLSLALGIRRLISGKKKNLRTIRVPGYA